jgi:tRNA dimethylallyltransferase
VLVGPTGSGKSGVALRIAEGEGATVLSVDSQQVYRGLDIGTAKPSTDEQRRVPHRCIDLVEPDGRMDAQTWATHARTALDAAEGRPVLAVGGTGLYLRALLEGLGPPAPADPQLRARLRAEEAAAPGSLRKRLQHLDPASHARIHPNDLVRTERAVEIVTLTGQPASHWFRVQRVSQVPASLVGLAWPRDVLRRRIEGRLQAMWAAGWVEEVRALRERGVPDGARGFAAIGYGTIVRLLRGEIDSAAARAEILRATLDYAKRQGTWFRGTKAVRWVDLRTERDLDSVSFGPGA